ncbi:MAG: TIGR04282 family arsenosugar biosynthesis glycosyltransferase [Hydrococcus sp. C42_A2020_068]|nr:TIGR04282 family arsenosugar biosynthesis glycosyltransferase [Hydrococcus sp. C42_A2020_068]
MSNQLIIFTRYPEPGKTKTRLIPRLGEQGAATLQRQMTEYTLTHARQLQSLLSLSVAIYYSGGSKSLIRDWLGSDLIYQQQSEGDLGQRMQSAFEQGFVVGIKQAVIIGIDCPELNVAILSEAFTALERYDLVLGPARDGGYYLIGLSRLVPQLFQGIAWGTSEVFAQTKAIAQKLKLSIHCLPLLDDVDRPEDLYLWQRVISDN